MRLASILLIFILLNSCGLSQQENDSVLKLISKIDSIGINKYENWDYYYRGFGVRTFYREGNNGKMLYSCNWRSGQDSIELLITSLDPFNKDFGISFLPDQQYDSYKLVEFSDCIKLLGMKYQDGLYQELVKVDSINYNTFFSVYNPVDFFKNQIDFYDDCRIHRKFRNSVYGGFIQFELNSGFILSYLPTGIDKNEKYLQGWSKAMEDGVMIKSNWNYRKAK